MNNQRRRNSLVIVVAMASKGERIKIRIYHYHSTRWALRIKIRTDLVKIEGQLWIPFGNFFDDTSCLIEDNPVVASIENWRRRRVPLSNFRGVHRNLTREDIMLIIEWNKALLRNFREACRNIVKGSMSIKDWERVPFFFSEVPDTYVLAMNMSSKFNDTSARIKKIQVSKSEFDKALEVALDSIVEIHRDSA